MTSYKYDDMIVVLVGRAEERFTIHKEIICARSKFSRAACTERWLEGQQKTVRLPEISQVAFQHYVDWIYTNDLALQDITQGFLPSVMLYLLGSYLDDMKFRNKSMELLVAVDDKLVETHPSCMSRQLIWENTAPNSLLRKWLIENTARRSSRCLTKNYTEVPIELWQQVVVKLKQMVEQGTKGVPQKASDDLEVENTE